MDTTSDTLNAFDTAGRAVEVAAAVIPIPFEERVGRVRSGLPSDPAFAVGALRELADMSLYDLFDADVRKAGRFAGLLRTPRVDVRCSLGKAAALSRAWRQVAGGRPDFPAAGAVLAAGPFALPASKKGSADHAPDASAAWKHGGGRPASWAASNPGGAGFAGCGREDGEWKGGSIVCLPLSERLASRALSRQRVLHSVLQLHYVAYLESVDAATGRADADGRRTWLEESWEVAPRVRFADIMTFVVEHADDARIPRIFDEFVFGPFADIYASLGEPGAS